MHIQCVPGPPPRKARASPYAGKRGTGDEARESLDVECEPSGVSPVSVFRDGTVVGYVSSVQG